jgi:hypothetical protein
MNREEFLKGIDNMSNHRFLLWEALHITAHYLGVDPVVEFGSGHGSTPYLKRFCDTYPRRFYSYDSDPEWCRKTGAELVSNWDDVNFETCSVLFLDHAPGERRKIDLLKYKDIAKVLVIHDSEPAGWNASDYQVRDLFTEFKYKVDLVPIQGNGAWATMLSNHIDLSYCVGKTFEGYTITA